MSLNEQIILLLDKYNSDFIRFVDISSLQEESRRGYSRAVIFGVYMTTEYLQMLNKDLNYVQKNVEAQWDFATDELYRGEMNMYQLSDRLSEFLQGKGFDAYSLSDNNQVKSGAFDVVYSQTPLPIKTIAIMAGLGWIGKNNLLVTPGHGSGLTMGCVLTDAPITTGSYEPILNRCGSCVACLKICRPGALKGRIRQEGDKREDMISINDCNTCSNCLSACTWTIKYIQNSEIL